MWNEGCSNSETRVEERLEDKSADVVKEVKGKATWEVLSGSRGRNADEAACGARVISQQIESDETATAMTPSIISLCQLSGIDRCLGVDYTCI